jgi:hypothetical protein
VVRPDCRHVQEHFWFTVPKQRDSQFHDTGKQQCGRPGLGVVAPSVTGKSDTYAYAYAYTYTYIDADAHTKGYTKAKANSAPPTHAAVTRRPTGR